MKKTLSLAIILSLAISVFSGLTSFAETATTQLAEFVKNGSFEQLETNGAPSDWTLSSRTTFGTHAFIDTDVVSHGTRSLRLEGTSGVSGGKMVSQFFTNLVPGSTYTLTAQYRVDSKTATNAGRIDLYAFDSSNTRLFTSNQKITTADSQWHTLTYEFTAPEGVAKMQICLRMFDGTVGYFDNVSVVGALAQQICDILDPLPGATNMLLNGTFETIGSNGRPQNWSINDATFNVTVSVATDTQRGNVLYYNSSENNSTPHLAYQTVSGLEVGATYQMSGWLKTVDIPALVSRKGPSFKIDFYDSDNVRIGEENAYDFQLTYGAWQQVAYQFTVPVNTHHIGCYAMLYGPGQMYFDDLQLHKVAEIPVVEMDTTHIFYTEWDTGLIELDYNYEIPAGSNYNVSIKKGDTTVLTDSVAVTAAHQSYSFDIDLLADYGAEYTLEVNCTDSNNAVVWSETKDIYRFNRPTALTNRGLPINGNNSEFYPVLGYTVRYEDVELAKSVGINVVSGYESADKTVYTSPNPEHRESTEQWLDTMWENGIMTMICLYRDNGTFASDSYMANVLDFIEDLGDHPGLLGYLVVDEPFNDWNVEKTTENLKKVYLAIRRADDKHIVAHVANRERFWDVCTDWSDMVICDRYPTATYFRNLQYNFIHHAKAESDGKKPVWTLYQTSQMDGNYIRTAPKHRNMIYQGMFAGGNSIGYIAVSAADSAGTGITSVPAVYNAAKEIIDTGELDDAVKAFITGEYPTFCEDSGSKTLLSNWGYYLRYNVPEDYWYKAYVKNNELYLLILNHEDTATSVEIPLTSTDGSVTVTNFSASVLDAVSTAQTVTGTDGVFRATIGAYDATLFKITTTTDLSGI